MNTILFYSACSEPKIVWKNQKEKNQQMRYYFQFTQTREVDLSIRIHE